MVLYDYAIVQATFNISSDVFMMLVPLPLILTVTVPIKQKLILLVIFSMGIFVIVAAVLTKAEFFISIYSDDYMFWYMRESSVAVYVANLPCIWPLLREALPALKSWTPGFVSSGMYKRRNGGHGTSTGPMTRGPATRTNVTRRSFDEFQKIVETPSTMTKSNAGSAVREIPYHERSRCHGGGATSDDSSEEMCLADGIRAHTTIEMRVIDPQGGLGEESSRRTSRDMMRSHNSSNGDFDLDLEKGDHVPKSNL